MEKQTELIKRLRAAGCHYGIPIERDCAAAADALEAAERVIAEAAAEPTNCAEMKKGVCYRTLALRDWLAAHATGQREESLTDVQRSIRDGTFDVRSATNDERAAEPPMAVELWAAGADQETARFVARMLHQQGYRLVKLDTGQQQGGDDE